MDDGANTRSSGSERARILLAKIAELLQVDTAFFLVSAPDRTRPPSGEAEQAELVRNFLAIGDAELRRSVLEMLQDLQTEERKGDGSGTAP